MPTTTASYTTLPGTLSGPISMRRGAASSFFLPDQQGNTRQLTDSSQAVTDTLVTDSWGREVASAGATVNPYKSFGQWGYYKDAANRQYVRARHLRNDLGRWTSRDPLGFGGGDWNLLCYALNDPVLVVDPSGMGGCGCPPGFTLQLASTWQCGEQNLGTTCLQCGVFTAYFGWPTSDPCRKKKKWKQDTPRTCHCPWVLLYIGTDVVATREGSCGDVYDVIELSSGKRKRVTRVDWGPAYSYKGKPVKASIDIYKDVFGKSINDDDYPVCVSTLIKNAGNPHTCWEGYGH